MIRLVEVFGVHLLTLDLRQHSARHTAALDEVFQGAGVCHDYAGLSPDERFDVLAKELENTRPLIPTHLGYSPETNEVIRTFRTVTAILERQCPEAIDKYIISSTTEPAHLLEVLLLAREARLFRPADGVSLLDIVPLFEALEPLADRLADHGTALRPAGLPPPSGAPGGLPGGDDRLLRQQQGERLAPVGLGPLPGPERPGRDRPQGRRHDADVPRPRRRRRPRGRAGQPGDPGPAPGDGRRPAPDHRAGRGHRRPLRPSRDRRAPPRTARPRRPPYQLPRRGRAARSRLDRDPRPPGPGRLPPLPGPGLRGPRVPRLLPPGHADRGDRPAQDRLPPLETRQVDLARPAPRHPLGLHLDAVPAHPARLVRPGRRDRRVPPRASPRPWRPCRRCTAAGRSGRP